MTNAKKWLSDPNPAGNPKIKPDESGPLDAEFSKFPSGVSICIKCDKTTYPKNLNWLKATKAKHWLPILCLKTGLGAFSPNNKIRVLIKVIDAKGAKTEIDDWKNEMSKHEEENPLEFINKNFFLPIKRVSITSIPTREQDVIALFNQLIAGGVIRGIRIMATNERFTYDGMYRVIFEKPDNNFIYHKNTNPLGVLSEYIPVEKDTFISSPKILEYKYSLDALIEDIENGSKNSNDIGLVIVWKTGLDYQGHYYITSLLGEDNLSDRQYHGITNILTNISSNQKEMDLIVLEELIQHLKNPEASMKLQKEKYEENY